MPTSPATAMIVATYGAISRMDEETGTRRMDSSVCSWKQKPNSSAAATEPSGVHRPKIMAASAM